MSFELLILFFFLVAVLYSMVGFGGGSSYIALLILFNTSHTEAPVLALTCNLLVVTGGAWHFWRAKNINKNLLFPFLITSIPMAYFGGLTVVNKETFQGILALCLLGAALRMLLYRSNKEPVEDSITNPPLKISLIVGSLLGYVSGLVGIGGGIFLAPILYTLHWGRPKQIASTATFFILLNSIAGILGQVQKAEISLSVLQDYWPLLLAVLLGGQVGSLMINFKLRSRNVEFLTALLILVVSVKILGNLMLSL
ncbi:MAG: sulfite exporter TauE/SafE family protein [Halobacteriovoraceae bacterium]|jgi:uncharacterized protein|nr:sulfite exporter TauE/SafE family protein [Halobacteriovoraceae bacterium]MBT5096060.1 sulfite exporter TauE/SafE family protein [Halobacteriovoraceae bacterium]